MNAYTRWCKSHTQSSHTTECFCQYMTAYTRWCKSHTQSSHTTECFCQYMTAYTRWGKSHTQSSHTIECICRCRTAYTRQPQECSGGEHYSNTLQQQQQQQTCKKTLPAPILSGHSKWHRRRSHAQLLPCHPLDTKWPKSWSLLAAHTQSHLSTQDTILALHKMNQSLLQSSSPRKNITPSEHPRHKTGTSQDEPVTTPIFFSKKEYHSLVSSQSLK